jgi:hypothetical protein
LEIREFGCVDFDGSNLLSRLLANFTLEISKPKSCDEWSSHWLTFDLGFFEIPVLNLARSKK